MLTTQRKQFLLDLLQRDGQINAKAVSIELDLSEDTIRRDLRELAAEGLLQRVHGGALPASAALGNFRQRAQIGTQDKGALAQAALGLIKPGMIVLLDGGTTAVQLAQRLPHTLRLTVITHSPSVAVALVDHALADVVMLGGRLFKHSIVNMGATALEQLGPIRADLFFLGVTGVHAEQGLTTGDLEEAHMKRALMAHAAETVVLASAEKINAASPFRVAALEEITTLIVPAATPDAALKAIARPGLDLLRS